jgi:uncharacterized protein involved in exopolysaccharide biosynthesis
MSASVKASESSDTNVLDLFVILAVQGKMILLITGGAALVSLLVALLLPKVYTATVTIMPPQQDQSTTNALLGQLIGGGVSGGGGLASALGLKNPNELYVGILKSRTIADRLIDQFGLKVLYGEDNLVDTRRALEDNTTIIAGKDGLIKIEFEDKDPKRAAAVANAYVKELEALTANLAISDASRRRLYFQKQVDDALEALHKAETALKVVQEQTGLIKPDDQAKPIFEAVFTLRAQIAAKEIELAVMSSFATDKNPNYVRAQQELAGMRKQLAGLERDNKLGSGDILIPIGKVPAAGMEYVRKYRDVKYQEAVYELLAKQLEIARIDEGKSATIIQVVDKAVEPDRKSKPKRALIVALSTLIAGMLAALIALVRAIFARSMADPAIAAQWKMLREQISKPLIRS